jgi:uncharacterized protein (DUF1330 family)
MATTEPSEAQIRHFRDADQKAPITMVNLLKFRDVAKYDESESAKYGQVPGREAYRRYAAVASRKIRENGGSILFLAPAEQLFVGVEDDAWDQVVIVEYQSRAAYLRGFDSYEYREAIRHRIAGLEKRLLLQCTLNQVSSMGAARTDR